MTRRRALLVAGAAFGVTLSIMAACGFPEVSYDGPTLDAGADASNADASFEPDTAPPFDATSEKPVIDACVDPCDCDGDGVRSEAGVCGGNDCDDEDSRANPTSSYRADLPSPDTKGDWNCDRFTERLIKQVNVKCTGTLDNCPSGREGLRKDVGCGELGEYVVCKPGGIGGCNEVDSGITRQECR